MAIPIPPPAEPVDPSYNPNASLVSIPAQTHIEEILRIIDRDGGVILTDFITTEQIADIDQELEEYRAKNPNPAKGALGFIPQETVVVPGLVGKSKTVAKICQKPILEDLRSSILQETYTTLREDVTDEHIIDPLLSISVTFNIGYGAPRQRLHRDDNVHGIRHGTPFELKKASQFGCLIAAGNVTRENGATMVIPGSHRWDDKRNPSIDEVCFAEMKPGSALIFLGSCYHAGGHNSVSGQIRKIHGLFFIRGNLRQEENQFLAVPRSTALTMDEKMLDLLGYKKPTTVLGIVDNEDPMVNLHAVLARASA